MPLHETRPVTPSQRFRVANRSGVAAKRPERLLTRSTKRSSGRNVHGRITSRRRGGGHKRKFRRIDFRREKYGIPARVAEIEYDPNRSANIALLVYSDGEKRYILAPREVRVGSVLTSYAQKGEYQPGNAMPLRHMPPAARLHALELVPNTRAQLVRSAGVSAQLVGIEGDRATIRMPSGELRILHADCRATLGAVGNPDHQRTVLGKAGRNRWRGRRPRVRGVAMNPIDHPMGGGEGRTSGGGHPVSPWGQLAKSYPTRRKSKPSNRQILVRANGRKVKQ